MSFRSCLIAALIVLSVLASGWAVLAADAPFWPRFHGPAGDNRSSDSGLLKEWPKEGPKLAWTAKGIGTGFSSVSLAGGRIYTAGNLKDKTQVTALDLEGQIQWQAECGEAWTNGPGGTRATPTLDGERLYYENAHGDVVCLDAASGKKLWGLNLLEKFGSSNITWGLSESLVIDGDRVLCLPGGPKVSVVALDKKTGEVAWKAPSAKGDLAGYATAALAEQDGLRMVLTMTAQALIGVNADTGDLLFRYPHKTSYDVNATTPLYRDGQVFITSGYGTTGSVMLKIEVQGKKASVTKLWGSRDLDNHHGGVVLVGDAVYGAAHNFNGGRWVCLDWKTGKKLYAERGVGKGSLTFAEGMFFTWSEDRKVGLAKATPKELELSGEFRTAAGPEGPTWAHPVVCGGRLYLRHGDNLYAYAVSDQ